jgi:hypothetical protein
MYLGCSRLCCLICCDSKDKTPKGKMKKTHRGQGGPWHEFVSRQSRGKKGRIPFADLAEAYRRLKLDEEAFQQLRTVGALKTKLLKLSNHNGRKLGVKNKASKMRAVRLEQLHLTIAGRAIAVQARVDGLFRNDPTAVAAFIEDATLSIKDRVRMVRSQVRGCNAKRVAKQDEINSLLLDWEAKEGAQQLAHMYALLPALRCDDFVFTPIPLHGRHGFDVSFGLGDGVAKMLSTMQSESKRSNAQSAVDKYVDANAVTLEETSCKSSPVAPEPSVCRDFGACTCVGSADRHLWILRNMLYVKLKSEFPASMPRRRDLLIDGYIVMKFIGTLDPSLEDDVELPDLETYYMHISVMYLRPYRTTFQFLTHADGILGEPQPTLDREYVKVQRQTIQHLVKQNWFI